MARRIAARRYAKALFALCGEKAAIDDVHADLTHLVSLLDQSEAWKMFVTEPSGSKQLRGKAINALLTGKTHPLTGKFMAFLDHKNRISILPDLVEAWTELYDEHKGLIRVRVISARPLQSSQKDALTQRLAQRLGKQVMLDEEVDPSIIGGVRILIGDQVSDFSIETQLLHLQKKLTYA
jgi:F-type H+-transporting ATPase subunit delta